MKTHMFLSSNQIPIFEQRSDGRDNLIGALLVAGHYIIPEVNIYISGRYIPALVLSLFYICQLFLF